jgi:hypothetical protein
MWHIHQHATPATLCLCSVPTENKGHHCGLGGNANFHHGGNAHRQQTTNKVPISSIPSRRQQSDINTHVRCTHQWTPGGPAVSLLLNLEAAQQGRSVLFSDEQKLLLKGGKKGFAKNTKLDFMRR